MNQPSKDPYWINDHGQVQGGEHWCKVFTPLASGRAPNACLKCGKTEDHHESAYEWVGKHEGRPMPPHLPPRTKMKENDGRKEST